MFSATWRFAISFIVLVSFYSIYRWAVVPWIEPPLVRAAPIDPKLLQRELSDKRDLSPLFPPGSWQLDQPKVIETGKGMLLFAKFDRTKDGRIELKPCSLILFPTARNARDNEKERGRPIILTAPDGAILDADPDMDITGPNISRIEGGHLVGDVVITGPPSAPGADDALQVVTSTVQFSKQRIWTTKDVSFRYGPHRGEGRDLSIYLTAQQGNVRKRSSQPLFSSGLRRMELVNVNRVELQVSSELFADKDTGKKSVKPAGSKAKTLPATVTCKGPFSFDILSRTATFEDQVEVAIKHPGGVIDQLLCPERLTIEFERSVKAGASVIAQSKKVPGKVPPKQSEFSGLKPSRVVAVGKPARMIMRSVESEVRAATIAYLPHEKTAILADPREVVVRHEGYRIRAPRVEYTMHQQSKRLGNLLASGPGHIDGFRKVKGRTEQLEGHWRGDLKIQRDERGKPVLSLREGASVSLTGTGSFASRNLFVWLNEVEKVRPPAQAPKQGALQEVGPPDVAKKDFELSVDRMAAYGDVDFDTPRLVGKTDSLELWVRYLKEAPLANGSPADASHSAATPAEKSEDQADSEQAPRKTPRKHRLAGRRIQIQMVKQGPKRSEVSDVTVDGDVQFSSLPHPDSPTPMMMVFGDVVRMSRQPYQVEEQSNLLIRGMPGRVTVRGASIVGQEIRFDQKTNRVWIDGNGEMSIPSQQRDPRRPPSPPMHLSWKGGMQFNGGRATFLTSVVAKGTHQLKDGRQIRYVVRSNKLDVTMSEFVDFSAAMKKGRKQTDVQPNNLIFSGSVTMDAEGLDAMGRRTSLEHMETESLTLNTKSESVRAAGPGWVSTVRSEGDAKKRLQPNAPGQVPQKKQLVYLQVTFRRTMEGNYGTQQVQFLGDVNTVYGPVRGWNDRLNADEPGGLGKEGILVKCDRLLVVQQTVQKTQWVDVTASGNAFVENEAFRAQAERLTYTQLKDRLVLEGGRDFAQMWLTRSMSTTPDVVARKVTYIRRTNQVKAEDARTINIQNFNGLLD